MAHRDRDQVDDHLACAVAGITADANILINYGISLWIESKDIGPNWPGNFTARLAAQRYTLTYQEPIPIEQLIVNICDRKQGYTQVEISELCSCYASSDDGNLVRWPSPFWCVLSVGRWHRVSLKTNHNCRNWRNVGSLSTGWDKNFGFQLYQSDPSGNYGGWKATAIGCRNIFDDSHWTEMRLLFVQARITKRRSRFLSRLAFRL